MVRSHTPACTSLNLSASEGAAGNGTQEQVTGRSLSRALTVATQNLAELTVAVIVGAGTLFGRSAARRRLLDEASDRQRHGCDERRSATAIARQLLPRTLRRPCSVRLEPSRRSDERTSLALQVSRRQCRREHDRTRPDFRRSRPCTFEPRLHSSTVAVPARGSISIGPRRRRRSWPARSSDVTDSQLPIARYGLDDRSTRSSRVAA